MREEVTSLQGVPLAAYQILRYIDGELAGAAYFDGLVAISGFHQIPLDETTSKICTFPAVLVNTVTSERSLTSRRHRKPSKTMPNQIFVTLAGVQVYVDDFLVRNTTP